MNQRPAKLVMSDWHKYVNELERMDRSKDSDVVMGMFYGVMLVALSGFWFWAMTNG